MPKAQKAEGTCKNCGGGITRQDLEEINKRLAFLEAQNKRRETDTKTCRPTLVVADDNTESGYRDKIRKKPTKTESFNDRTRSRRRRSPYRHTVPSDKDESQRIEEFRNECISKALKSNSVDIVGCYTRKDNPAEFRLPTWLSEKELRLLEKKPDIKYQSRTLLAILREKKFDVAHKWIEESGLDETVKNHIWKTYEEFNDAEHILKRMCIFCILKLQVDVSDVIDHFYSIEMISEELYRKINISSRKKGSQDEFWNELAEQCKTFPIQSYVKEALRIALKDIAEEVEDELEKEHLQNILKELIKRDEGYDVFQCNCKDICSKELQPMSLLKSMSLAKVYSSPEMKRKQNSRCNAYENPAHSSLTSSCDSITSDLQIDSLKCADETTFSNESIDDRYITLKNPSEIPTDNRRKRRASKQRIRDNECTLRKEINTSPSEAEFSIRVNARQDNDADVEEMNATRLNRGANKSKGSINYTKMSGQKGEKDIDHEETPGRYRVKTRELLSQQQLKKELRNITSYKITAANVNINSTIMSKYRNSSSESA